MEIDMPQFDPDLVPQVEDGDVHPPEPYWTGTTGHQLDPEGVDHPVHYNVHPSGVECIVIIEHMPFNTGTAVKYLWREGLKDDQAPLKDLRKARWYIDREISRRSAAEGVDPGAPA